jgi:hypothetical protein
MATEPRTTRLGNDVDSRLDEFADDHELSGSKAAERCIDEGLRQYGYGDGVVNPSGRRVRYLNELARGLLWTGTLLFVLSVLTVLSLQFTAAVLWLVAALALLAAEKEVTSLGAVREVVPI